MSIPKLEQYQLFYEHISPQSQQSAGKLDKPRRQRGSRNVLDNL